MNVVADLPHLELAWADPLLVALRQHFNNPGGYQTCEHHCLRVCVSNPMAC